MLIVYWPITIKFRIGKQTSKPQTNYRCCLRFSYLTPYWLISRMTITFHKYFWCSQFCEFHSNKLCRLTIKQRRLNESITFEKVFWYPTQVFQCSVQGQCEVSFPVSLLSLINHSNYGFTMQAELKAKRQFIFKFTSDNGLPHYLHVLLTYRKKPKISPGAYIFQRPFLRGLSMREICVSKSSGLAVQLEVNLPFLLCFRPGSDAELFMSRT